MFSHDEMRRFSSKTDATDKEPISSWKNVSKSDCWTKDISTMRFFFFFSFIFYFCGGGIPPSCLCFLAACLFRHLEEWSLQKGCHTNCWMGARVPEGTAGWQWAVKTTWPSRCSFNWCYWFPILPANLNALWVEENLSHCFGEWPAESF